MKVLKRTFSNGEEGAREKTEGKFNFSNWSELPALPTTTGSELPRAEQRVGIWERAIALGMIVIFSPVMALTALVIKVDSPGGPVVYKQDRVGLNRRQTANGGNGRSGGPDRRKTPGAGTVFPIYKFRTMVPDAEKLSGPVWASEKDPRITRLGLFLRKTRLDELPQLFNVLFGHMRLIGPRPERPHFVRELSEKIPDYTERLQVHPGITGLAQIEREYDSDLDDVKKKVRYDLYYARHRDTVLDMKIMLKTVEVVLRRKGAH
jgi:lipopolysaccharide/colanic/teichoic acid biosynthesis glycosyltransferase